jgi:hypothetical protein
MANPQVAGAGEGLQIWKVAAKIMNRQSQMTKDMEGSCEDNE